MKYITLIINFIKSHVVLTILGIVALSGVIATPVVIHNLSNKDEIKNSINDNIEQDTQLPSDAENNGEIFETPSEIEDENSGDNTDNKVNNSTPSKPSNNESSSNKGDSSSKPNTNTENNSNNNSNNNSSNSNNSVDDKNETNFNNNNNNNNNQSTPSNPDTTHQNKLNLNDNIEYYIRKTGPCKGEYHYVKETCINKTLKELLAMYPNNNRTGDTNEYVLNLKLYENGVELQYFPECEENITPSIIDKLNNELKGIVVTNYQGSKLDFNYLIFKNSSYFSFSSLYKLNKYNLVNVSACGGMDDETYNILDETTCQKYKLSCDRW